jgi:hypothetical protein
MNYARIYEAFIQDRLTKQPEAPEYFERHHIKPRCLGGGDEPENIIRLTPEDHIFAHVLLAKWLDDRGSWAAVKFIFGQACKNLRAPTRREIRLAARARKEFAARNTGANNPNYGKAMPEWHKERLRQINTGKKHSQESVERRRQQAIGRPSPRKGCKLKPEQIDAIRKANTGRKHSPEAIEKIRAAHLGRVFSAQHRERISIAKLGKKKAQPVSEETRKKLSIALKGKSPSQEARKKMSASRLGRTHSQETIAAFSASRAGSGNPRARSVVCETTGDVFGCVKDAAERFGIVSSTLRAALNRSGGDATVKGLQFRKM